MNLLKSKLFQQKKDNSSRVFVCSDERGYKLKWYEGNSAVREEILFAKDENIKNDFVVKDAIYVLDSEDVIYKELNKKNQASDESLRELFPSDHEFIFSKEYTESGVQVYAIPEKNVKDRINELSNLGVGVEDVLLQMNGKELNPKNMAESNSLLPSDLQRKKKSNAWKKMLLRSFLIWATFVALFSMNEVYQMYELNVKAKDLQIKHKSILMDVKESKVFYKTLINIENSQNQKMEILNLVSYLSKTLSGHVELRELKLNREEIILKGGAEKHSSLSSAIDSLREYDLINDVELVQTRLRKKMNKDYLEFELVAKWKN